MHDDTDAILTNSKFLPENATGNLAHWHHYLESIESPNAYIVWTFYTIIAAALQRRVCFGARPEQRDGWGIYPNPYIIFIAKAGIGKSTAADEAKKLFKSFETPSSPKEKGRSLVKIAPSSSTLEALLRFLNDNPCTFKAKKEDGADLTYLHASLAFFATKELATLIRENTGDLVNFLSEGWEGQDFIRATKTQGTDFIYQMCLTLLGCATPDWVRDAASTGMLKQGFSARTIFVFASKNRKLTPRYTLSEAQRASLSKVRDHIEKLSTVYGEVKMGEDALAWYDDWYLNRNIRTNQDKRLDDYYVRKKLHLIKLAMLVHFADSTTLEITIKDLEAALSILNETELTMHRALLGGGKNDLYTLAQEILLWMNTQPEASSNWNRIYGEFFSEAPLGKDGIDAALSFLAETKQLTMRLAGGQRIYTLSAANKL